jgi:hypothetical protein
MKLFVKICCFLVFILSLSTQAQETFPKSWEGSYEGKLEIYKVNGIAMAPTMKFEIAQKTDSIYTWKMTYILNGKEDVRDYELILKDTEKGIYTIDEKNTILIDSYYRNGILTSFFEVMDSFIITSTQKLNSGELMFEIIAAQSKNSNKSGNKKYQGQQIPEVTSYLVNGRQKALLKKVH